MSNPVVSDGSASATEPRGERNLSSSEPDVAELRRQLLAMPGAEWLRDIIGSQKNEPAFAEVIALGRAHRMADVPPDNDQP